MGNINHEIIGLDNGSTLCFVDVPHTEVVRIGVQFPQAGDLYSPPDKPELAHVAEHMTLAGCQDESLRTARDFRRAIERNGGYTVARTYPERLNYSLGSPTAGHEQAIESFVRGLEAPRYSAAELASEIGIVEEELVRYANNEHRIVWHALMQAIGRNDPSPKYALSRLAAITPEDLHEHHRRTHVTPGMNVVITGSQDRIDRDGIRLRFAGIQLGSTAPPTVTPAELVQPEGPVFVERSDMSNIYWILGRFGIDNYPYPVDASTALLEGHLFHYQDALIYEGARDAGLAYEVGGSIATDRHGTDLFQAFGEVTTSNAAALWWLVRLQLDKAFSGITAHEFEEVRRNKIGKFHIQYENADNVHSLAMGHLRRFGEFHPPQELIGRLEAITVEEYQAGLRQLFTGGVALAGVAGKNVQQHSGLRDELQNMQDFLASV